MKRFALGVIAAALVFAPSGKASAQTQSEQTPSLAETHWAGQVLWSNRDAPDPDWTLYFRSDGVLVYSVGGESHEDGAWRQHNRLVTFETSDSSSVQLGAVHGDVMEGVAYNQAGQQGRWTFRLQAAQVSDCPHNMVALRGATAPLVCICPQNISIGTVWGEPSAYTDDSDICTAAVHAGVVTAGDGGRITVTAREGQASYQGSTANGVTTQAYGSWAGSYTISTAKAVKRE